MEFRFAHIALKKPIVLAVVGTGYKWDATEVNKHNISISNSELRHLV